MKILKQKRKLEMKKLDRENLLNEKEPKERLLKKAIHS